VRRVGDALIPTHPRHPGGSRVEDALGCGQRGVIAVNVELATDCTGECFVHKQIVAKMFNIVARMFNIVARMFNIVARMFNTCRAEYLQRGAASSPCLKAAVSAAQCR
jgi:hypothetical protein